MKMELRFLEHHVEVIDLAFAEAVPTQFNIRYIHRAASCHITSGCPVCLFRQQRFGSHRVYTMQLKFSV